MDKKIKELKNKLKQMERVVVAFSGGVDSTLLLKISHDILGNNAVGLTLTSPSIPEREVQEAKQLGSILGIQHIFIESNEVENPDYQENSPNRCYVCRAMTFKRILNYAQEHGFHYVLDGANADDADDHRPGRKAAQELGIRSPLLEVGLGKDEIRKLARQFSLPNWNKPSAACLSSRIPYGTRITDKILKQVENAEDHLRELGIDSYRVRHHDQVARIEVPADDFDIILENKDEIIRKMKDAGYSYVALDLDGFRSGSMNEVLP